MHGSLCCGGGGGDSGCGDGDSGDWMQYCNLHCVMVSIYIRIYMFNL